MKTDHPDGREKRYVPLGLIGTGAMAEVYRCRLSGPQGFEKLVAQKKLLPRWARDPIAIADFVDEARLGGLLFHENIAQIFDFGESDGSYFLTMECLYGKDLRAVMQRMESLQGGMPAGHALYIAARICAGMEYAHQLKDLRQRPLNLVHRELSPDNIVVTYEGKVKIIDFGCARADLFDDRTRMGMVKGQIPYMAPEQLTATAVDQRADIFAIGILLYEMLSGRRMYGGDTATLIMKCRNAEYARLESVVGKLPPSVCAIVEKALQSDRKLRYQSCGQMLEDIEACLSAIQPQPSSQLLGRYLRWLFAGDLPEEKKRPARIAPAVAEEHEEGAETQLSADAGDRKAVTPRRGFRLFRTAVWFVAGGLGLMLAVFLLSSDLVEEEKIPPALPEPPLQQAMAEPAPQVVVDLPRQAEQVLTVSAEQPARLSTEQPAKRPVEQPVKRAVSPDIGRAKKIDAFLAKAAEAWKDKRLTDPEKDCAFWFYSRILALDPKNVDAWQGIEQIGKYYGDQAEQALDEHKFQEAERYVQRGLQVFPENRRLIALQGEMGAHVVQYIAELAGKAEKALLQDNLTIPVEACAYTYYKKILKLDKRNDAALDGIDKIADRYAELGEDAYRNLQVANCREFVKSGLSVAPHHPKLLKLQEDLDRSMPGIFFKSLQKSLSTMFE